MTKCLLLLSLIVCAQEPSSRDPLGAKDGIPVLLVSGADTFHNWRRTTPQTRAILEASGKFDVRVSEDIHILESAAALAQYRAVFFNQQADASTPALRRSLREYLEQGGGLVALHWAIDNFHDWPEFATILGRVWREGESKEEHGVYRVRVADHDHPITRGMEDFTTSEEEAVHYRLHGDAPIHVLAVAMTAETKEDAPVMWTHAVGKGRVFFSPFGHSEAGRKNPGVQRMILRATEWAATGQVTE